MNPIIHYIKQTLQGYYPGSEAVALAKLLLVQVFGFSVLELYGGKDRSFSEKEKKQLDDILGRLQKYEPIQYIIGREDFHGLSFEVNEQVLVPRPETKELVDWILEENRQPGCRVLDVGTGSGCISVTLAKFLPQAKVTSWDISAGALRVAARNCRRNGVEVCLVRQDVLASSPAGEQYDIIVSNPPYVTEREKAMMGPNVLAWEPATALFVPDDDPLLFYRKIASLGIDMLANGGKIYFEVNRDYGRETVKMLENMGFQSVELRKDLFGNDRMVRAVR